MTKLNRLSQEKSPYLLQHQANPVDWFPWGEEAFEKAKREDKPIFLSVGYSTCYWCHVMEKDSFETAEVADVLNRHFVSIKVDREERPDVDQIYMDAVVAMSGHGGWPMSVFLTPDRKPFFGATFFYRAQFVGLLNKITDLWTRDRAVLRDSAAKVTEHLDRSLDSHVAALKDGVLLRFVEELQQNYDGRFGGFGSAPKFPPSAQISALLRSYRRSGDARALEMAETTLARMAAGGIYDQLGGGFHRYSTDEKWLAPHFEKMLYDNALLSRTYLETYQLTKKKLYADVARETLDYVLREMTDTRGGFYSAEDAGEVGKEGEFYVWSEKEIDSVLTPDDAKSFKAFFGVTATGNFEGHNILALDSARWSERGELARARAKLLAARNDRHHPHKDDKVLTSWNGLMIGAFAHGYRALGDERYLRAATKCAAFIRETLYTNGELLHRYREGDARLDGTLEDYAYLIHGLIELYLSSSDPRVLAWALELQKKQDALFWDSSKKGYFFTSEKDKTLIVRKKEMLDGATPAANSVSALNLLRLASLTASKELEDRAKEILESVGGVIERAPSAFSFLLQAADYELDSSKEVAVIYSGKAAPDEIRKYLFESFLPNVVFSIVPADEVTSASPAIVAGKKTINDRATIYVCERQTCKEPTNELVRAKESIEQFLPLK